MDSLELQESIRSINLNDIAARSIEDNRESIADMNAAQMAQGLRADGSEILPYYADLTISMKKKRSGLSGVFDHVTLYNTGAHYAGLYAEVKGDEIEYGSRDEKSAVLQKKYNTAKGSIYGLSTDSREDLAPAFKRSFFAEYERQTGLKAS